jgi:hypothetical protein
LAGGPDQSLSALYTSIPGCRILSLADMDQPELCERCELLTLEVLEQEHGHLLHPDLALLREEAKRDGGCNMCSLIWWALMRYEHPSLLGYGKAPVRLVLNPPRSKTSKKIHGVDIVVTSRDISELTWYPLRPGEPWILGPLEYLGDIVCGHLTLYGIHGMCIANSYGCAETN